MLHYDKRMGIEIENPKHYVVSNSNEWKGYWVKISSPSSMCGFIVLMQKKLTLSLLQHMSPDISFSELVSCSLIDYKVCEGSEWVITWWFYCSKQM